MKWIIASVVAVLALVYVGAGLRAPGLDEGYDLDGFGKVPVVSGGRVKPLDSLARNALLTINHRQTFTDDNGKRRSAMRWLSDVMTFQFFSNPAMVDEKVFRIEHEDVLSLMGLQQRPGLRYSIREFNDKLADLSQQAQRAVGEPEGSRTLFQRKVLELQSHMILMTELVSWQTPLVTPAVDGSNNWVSLMDGIHGAQQNAANKAFADGFTKILKAFGEHDAAAFNQAVRDYREQIGQLMPTAAHKAELESLFNRAQFFYHAAVLYVIGFLLIAASWLGGSEKGKWLRSAGVSLLMVTLAVHTAALLLRMYLQGRPPVTNLYSSAVFVGWGAVVIGLFVEWLHRNGLGAAMSAVCGFVTLLIAHHLATGEDTLGMMRAVLDTNLWLATHVTCITIGYSATILAGLLGGAFVLTAFFTPFVDTKLWKQWASMIYGITCFSLLFSFVGTVLGGIWADQSWGRFWGWDPKENGALLIVLANAILLHARWGGLVRQRGIAMLAVFGNMVVAWSWFGVNMLGVGLHSYGFIASQQFWLVMFEFSQLAIIIVGWLPLSVWRSPGANGKPPALPLHDSPSTP